MKSAHRTVPSPRYLRWPAALCAACLLTGVTLSDLSAQTAATWNGGMGNWSNGSLWSTGTVPNSTSLDVFIDGGKNGVASNVNVDGGYNIGRLTVDAGDTVTINSAASGGASGEHYIFFSPGAFTGAGTLVNNGLITLNATGAYAGSASQIVDLRADNASLSFTGTGTVQMTDSTNNRIFGDSLSFGAGQTVRGGGQIFATTITNAGLLDGTGATYGIVLAPTNLTNTGTLRASAGGLFTLSGGTTNNAGGTITAVTGSTFQLANNATVTGGTLTTAGSGQVVVTGGATLTNVTNNGTLGVNDNVSVVLTGTLTNNGTLTLNSTGNLTDLRFLGATTLAGTGTVNLIGANARVFTNNLNGERLTIGAGQTISGQGNVGIGKTTFTNNGTVNANVSGATLTIQPGSGNGSGNDFTNGATGVLQASNGGTLALNGSSGGVFNLGGTVQALAGSTVNLASNPTLTNTTLTTSGSGAVVVTDGATLTNVTNNGTLNVNNNAAIIPTGTLTNNGTITLNGAGNNFSDLRFVGATTLTGTGTVNLVGTNARVFDSSTGGARLTIGQNQTISGQGNLGVGSTTFTNNGTINANMNGATLTIQPGGGAGDFTNNNYLQAFNGGTLALSNAGGGKFTNNSTFFVQDGSTLTVSPGALTNFSGTTLTGGTYYVQTLTNATATLSLGGGAIITNRAVVELNGAGSVFNEINAIATNASGATLDLFNGRNFTTVGALTNAGLIEVNGGITNGVITNGGTLTVSGALNNSGTLHLYASGNAVVQGNVVSTGQLRVLSGSTFAVQGTLTISGPAQTGIVVPGSPTPGIITATGALTQTTGGVLAGGTFTAPTLSLAGGLRPGDNIFAGSFEPEVGTMTLNGQVGMLGSTALVFDLASTAASDRIAVNGALTLDGTLNVNALAGFGVGRYDLIDYTGTLTNNTLDLGTLPGGYNYAIDTSIAGQVDLVVTNAVPEPSTWAAVLLGIGSLAFVLRRRLGGVNGQPLAA